MTTGRWIRRIDLLALAAVGIAVAYAMQFRRFLTEFPTSYAWSELMIAYQGGYVRRGLLGELAFLLDGTVGAEAVLAIVVAAAYAGVLVCFVRAARAAPRWIGMLFVLSPATLLFPLLDPDAFGRKDAAILLAFALCLRLARDRARGPALALMALVYAGANFVVDSAIFYAPMAIFAGLWLARPCPGTGALVRGSLVSWLLLLAVSALNLELNAGFDADNMLHYQQVIAQAWRARYPDAFQVDSAVEYIGMSVRDGIELVVQDVSVYPTAPFYAVCLLLALVPVLLLLRHVRWDRIGGWERTCGAYAVGCGFLPFAFAADWGRYIHLLAMQLFVLVLCLPMRPRPDPIPSRSSWPLRAAAVVAVLAYATGWRMMHFIDGGGSALAPGLAFLLP